MNNLDDFKVELLEQRLEMGEWGVDIIEVPSPDGPFEPYESVPVATYTISF